jgi:hypothetical protein
MFSVGRQLNSGAALMRSAAVRPHAKSWCMYYVRLTGVFPLDFGKAASVGLVWAWTQKIQTRRTVARSAQFS